MLHTVRHLRRLLTVLLGAVRHIGRLHTVLLLTVLHFGRLLSVHLRCLTVLIHFTVHLRLLTAAEHLHDPVEETGVLFVLRHSVLILSIVHHTFGEGLIKSAAVHKEVSVGIHGVLGKNAEVSVVDGELALLSAFS